MKTSHLHDLVGIRFGKCVVAGGVALSLTAAGGLTAPIASAEGALVSAAPQGSGPVDVLYAGSLVDAMTKQIGPASDKATGYAFTGFSGGSDALATEIKGKTQAADVFVSASPKVNAKLRGASNGNWVSWYATFATSRLVLGYNPKSKFAHALRTQPWYDVIGRAGFRIGRTDPATDPKGVLAVTALNSTARAHKQPGLVVLGTKTSDVFPEETLVGRLQAGQLDAGFFYAAEASAANIKTVPLAGIDLKATYTVTVLNHAPHPAGAAAFVQYLLGAAGRKTLGQDGFVLANPPRVTGAGVPAGLKSVLSAS